MTPRPGALLALGVGWLASVGGGCGRGEVGSETAPTASAAVASASAAVSASASVEPPAPASAPSAEEVAPPVASSDGPAPLLCPTGMASVRVEGLPPFCIDQYEASLVDRVTGATLSPYYPPHQRLAVKLAERWEQERRTVGCATARETPIPPLPAFQREREVDFQAVSRRGVVPSGYLSALDAERACKNAGKRLCRHREWVAACKGSQQRAFPYGDSYQHGACNACRAVHPAVALHDNASRGHLDPRLNQVKEGSDPLLRPTGSTPRCRSDWGEHAAYDMYGNLDEWVEDEHGRFAGGFYARGRRDGCQASITAHPREYFDYSLGTRCCLSSENE